MISLGSQGNANAHKDFNTILGMRFKARNVQVPGHLPALARGSVSCHGRNGLGIHGAGYRRLDHILMYEQLRAGVESLVVDALGLNM